MPPTQQAYIQISLAVHLPEQEFAVGRNMQFVCDAHGGVGLAEKGRVRSGGSERVVCDCNGAGVGGHGVCGVATGIGDKNEVSDWPRLWRGRSGQGGAGGCSDGRVSKVDNKECGGGKHHHNVEKP